MRQAPRPVLLRLNAGKPSRDLAAASGRSAAASSCRPMGAMCPAAAPEGTAMLAALSREHIANAGRLGSGPALGPKPNAVGKQR
jgi:hypothetical protein